ncbi:hypothetical protein B0J11DRAFT_509171 [Dendryphion nanum]|uniref:Uncharacterized protein n=1 Tax=Dendryphion nanum TaxID=256645 RepID=A0A9P9DI52_9PLEO|nr:hypothetical protein B0J11DRAFT_509171 [Dendryphion nanum]
MSRFLTLPAELRDQITRYVITHEAGLFTTHVPGRGVWIFSSSGEDEENAVQPNQLQFVCRQLRFETRDMTLNLNSLTFTPIGIRTAMDIFSQFKKSPLFHTLENYGKTITISDKVKYTDSGFRTWFHNHIMDHNSDVYGFCNYFPKSFVVVRFPIFGLHKILAFNIFACCAVQSALHSVPPPTFLSDIQANMVDRTAADLTADRYSPELRPVNLLVFPSDENYETLMARLEHDPPPSSPFHQASAAAVRQWFEAGF